MQGVCYKAAKGLRTTTIEKCGGVKAKNTQCARWKPVDKCCTSLSPMVSLCFDTLRGEEVS